MQTRSRQIFTIYAFQKEKNKVLLKNKLKKNTTFDVVVILSKVIIFFFNTWFMAVSIPFGIRAFKTELNKVL